MEHRTLGRCLRFLPAALLVAYLAALGARFAYKGQMYLSFFTDDYFYYLVVARNLVLNGSSTFNGLQLTNGYHPLWLLVNAALVRMFGSSRGLFVSVVLLIWFLVCGAYLALRRTQKILQIDGQFGLSFALFSITFMAVVSRTGMEVSLALFVLITLWARMAATALEDQTPAEAVQSGLLAAAFVLSRLDACLVIAAYCALTLAKPGTPRRVALQRLLWFGVGLFPVAIYAAVNVGIFGTVLPISGMAKNLKPTLVPSASTIITLAHANVINVLFTWPSIIIWLLFVVHVCRGVPIASNGATLATRRVQLCVLAHPFVFYAFLSCSSDWPMWTWYLYPLVPVSALLGPTALTTLSRIDVLSIMKANVTVGACLIAVIMSLAKINYLARPIYEQAVKLRDFSQTHPGRYGMGDAAGTPAYLMSAPIVQLEGLMGDKQFLNRVRRQEPLLQALNELDIDYYVSTRASLRGGCYEVREPAEAGPRSPVMQARLCMQPLMSLHQPYATDMVVFDVRGLNAVRPEPLAGR